MSSTVLAARAVTAEYAKRLLRPILWIGIAAYILVMLIVGWIAYAASPWWILLGFIPTTLFCVGLAVWIGVRVTAARLEPRMNKAQKTAAKKVVTDLNSAAEHLGTPKFFLLFRIIQDVLFPPKSRQTLIGELADTPGQLHRSFNDLRKLF